MTDSNLPPLRIHLLAPGVSDDAHALQQHDWLAVRDQILPEVQAIFDHKKYIERSLPRPLRFAWALSDPAQDHAAYDLLIAETPDFRGAQVFGGLTGTEAEVVNLKIGRRYYWKVLQRRGEAVTAESPVAAFETRASLPRWVAVPGITNVRDVGGWLAGDGRRVRQGLVYRSAEMNTHITLLPEAERVLLEELGIRTDLDLRGTADDENPAPALPESRVTWASVPFYAYGELFDEKGMAAVRRAFDVLSDPASYPVLMHCWAGADRTGTLCFLLNGVLGVGAEDLAHDYELTTLSLIGPRSRENREYREMIAGLATFGRPDAELHERIEAFLQASGVTPAQIARLRDLMLE